MHNAMQKTYRVRTMQTRMAHSPAPTPEPPRDAQRRKDGNAPKRRRKESG